MRFLIALFVTGLLTAQVIASKIVPVAGFAVPAGVLAYSITYFASDCTAELYGRERAHELVRLGFAMMFVFLPLTWIAVSLPTIDAPAGFDETVFASTNIVAGSLAAYVVSQSLDVELFTRLPGALWARNIASTSISQFVDTVVFISLAFYVVPSVLGVGFIASAAVIVELIAAQWIVKLGIAVADTPLVMAFISLQDGE